MLWDLVALLLYCYFFFSNIIANRIGSDWPTPKVWMIIITLCTRVFMTAVRNIIIIIIVIIIIAVIFLQTTSECTRFTVIKIFRVLLIILFTTTGDEKMMIIYYIIILSSTSAERRYFVLFIFLRSSRFFGFPIRRPPNIYSRNKKEAFSCICSEEGLHKQDKTASVWIFYFFTLYTYINIYIYIRFCLLSRSLPEVVNNVPENARAFEEILNN